MKFIVTADLHQASRKWDQLEQAVEQEQPDFVLIAGDLFPHSGGFKGQKDFIARLTRRLARMRQAGTSTILIPGNDDFAPLESTLNELEAKGICVNVNGKIHRDEGLLFAGCSFVRDFPFGYKDWVAADDGFVECHLQFCGQGLTVDDAGKWVELTNLREHLLQRPSLRERLDTLANQISNDDWPASVWLLHQPPDQMGMDICGDGQQVGSPTVREFIRKHQPLFGISGHIHESPYQPGGKWIGLARDTIWFQPGQVGEQLHYIWLELTDAMNIRGIRHSVFGGTAIEFERFAQDLRPKHIQMPQRQAIERSSEAGCPNEGKT